MKRRKLIRYMLALVLLVLISQIVYAGSNEPGSDGDPLVTLSYVEQRIDQMKFYIDESIASVKSGGGNTSLVVVELKSGERLIAEQGAEIILRGGNGIAIDSPLGGLSDITAARDIKKDEAIPPNHLLIIPRDDGRGVKAVTDCILMVRGAYTIEK